MGLGKAFKKGFKQIGGFASKAAKQTERAVSKAYKQTERTVSKAGHNLEGVARNMVHNPIGAIGTMTTAAVTGGTFGTGALAAASTTNKGAKVIKDLNESDEMKVVGAGALAVTAGAGIAAATGAAAGTAATAGTTAASTGTAASTAAAGASAATTATSATAAATGASAASGGLSALEATGLIALSSIGTAEYTARKAEKQAKKDEKKANQKEAEAREAANQDYKAVIEESHESYRQKQTAGRYNFTTEAGAFGDYGQTSFAGFDPETGAFQRRKRYI